MKNIKELPQQLNEVERDLKPLFKQWRIYNKEINILLQRKYNLQININQVKQTGCK